MIIIDVVKSRDLKKKLKNKKIVKLLIIKTD
jgi:hypothetical protein